MPICGLVRNTPSASKSPAIALGFFVLIPQLFPNSIARTEWAFLFPNSSTHARLFAPSGWRRIAVLDLNADRPAMAKVRQ